MLRITLILLTLISLAACSDSGSGNSDGTPGSIVPVDQGWVWTYRIQNGDETFIDSLWYIPVEGFEHDGISQWYEVSWGVNDGDNPALATVDEEGLRMVWPDRESRTGYDRYGRKCSQADVRTARSLDYYLVKYPIQESQGWHMFDDSDWIECVALADFVETEYCTLPAIRYTWWFVDDPEILPEEFWFKPGYGMLKNENRNEPQWINVLMNIRKE